MKQEDIKLFEKYRMTGYLVPAKDGIYLDIDTKELKAIAHNTNNPEFEQILEADEGIEKTYYELRKAKGKGVVVGFKDIVVKGELYAIYEDALDVGLGMIPEQFFAAKQPKEVVKCAIMYYADNKKHLVPLDNIEPIKERDKGYER